MNLKEFNLKRDSISECYSKIAEISNALKDENISGLASQSMNSLKSENFNIVIVGEFSRGKSTFINALLGKRVLPSSTKPTTTIINKISFGEEPEFTINFRESSSVKKVTEDEFKDITAKLEPDYDDEDEVEEYNKNLEFISSISYAEIKYPTRICEEGIEIVDTPGTNDLDQAREEITFKFIPKSDIAILLLSANQILSQTEINFLKERILDNDIKKVFFIINFKDRLETEQDREKVMAYAVEHLSDIVDDPKIFMVSAKGALNYRRKEKGESFKGAVPDTLEETGFIEMEKDLVRYLTQERGQAKLKKHIDRSCKLADDLINSTISIKLESVELSLADLEKKLNKVRPHLEECKKRSKSIIGKMKATLYNLEDGFVNHYKKGLEDIAIKANIAANNYEGELDAELIAREVESVVAPLQMKLQKDLELYKKNFIDSEVQMYLNKIHKLWDDISLNSSDSLINIDEEYSESRDIECSNLTEESFADLLSGLAIGGFVIATISIPFIAIPAAIFGGKYFLEFIESKKRDEFLLNIKKEINNRYAEIIPSQIDQFRAEYRKGVEATISSIENQVYFKIQGLENQVESLIDEKRKEDLNVEKEKQIFTFYKSELESVKTKLEGVM